jgi:hypothetical protein
MITVLIVGVVTMFGLTNDPAMRNRLLGFFDTVIPFIIGTGAGASVGFVAGKLR